MTPPLRPRLFLALSQLQWPEAAIERALQALDAAEAQSAGPWTARVVPPPSGAGHAPSRGLELWRGEGDSGPWLALRRDAVVEGTWHASAARSDATPRLTTADLDALRLPRWLGESGVLWRVVAPGLQIHQLDLPGDRAADRLQSAAIVLGGQLSEDLSATLSTCPARDVTLEVRTDAPPSLVVKRPAPRVAAWIARPGAPDAGSPQGGEGGVQAADLGFLLASREIEALYIQPPAKGWGARQLPPSEAWRLA